jgi:DNA-binding transcriptional regulator YdaS (Cro superfamily)
MKKTTKATDNRPEFRIAVDVVLARAGVTQRRLARLLNVADTTLSGWLTGAHAAPRDLARRIESALRLRRGELDS